MYPSRPPVPSGPGQSYKFTVVETCERIKDEFNFVQQQCHQLQTEREKLLSERVDMQRICVVYYEMANGLNLEMHRQMEISKRLNAILNQVIPFLATEHQSQVASAIERAKQVTMQELNSVLTAQMEDSKLAKFANGGNMGLSNDQLEIYKQIQAHQISSAGSPTSSLPGSSSANQAGPHGSNVGSAPATGAAFPGSTPGLLPSTAPGLQNAFINGLMSAAGGAMMPPPGTAGLPLGSGGVRDIKDYSSEDKQRVAAAAAAAASQLFRGGAVGQPNLPGSPFLPGGPAAIAAAASFPEGFFGAAAAAAGGGVATTSPGVVGLSAPGRTSSAGGGVRSNSGHSGVSGSAGPASSSLLPPPPPPTPGNSSTAPTPPDEKRRKVADPKLECPSRENGGCRSADDMDKSSTSSAMSMNTSRSGRQPLNLSPQLPSSMGSNYPTTNSAPAVGTPHNRSTFSENRSKYGGKGHSSSCSGPGTYSYVVLPGGGGTRPCALASAPEATSNPNLPRRLQHLASLPHGEVVCAVTIAPAPSGRGSSPTSGGGNVSPSTFKVDPSGDGETAVAISSTTRIPHFAYTGGRGCVKLWDLDAIAGSSSSRDVVALASFDCLRPESYVRSIKLFPDCSTLLIGGESSCLTIWDLNGPGRRKADLTFDAPACYALALSPDCKLCYSCCSDGQVAIWDIHNQSVVQQFHAHADGASCIELVGQGTRLWTGGLDNKVRCWDIRGTSSSRLHHVEFKSQVFSLGLSPVYGMHGRRPSLAAAASPMGAEDAPSSESLFYGSQWLAVGLESSEVEVVAIGPDGPPSSAPPSTISSSGTPPNSTLLKTPASPQTTSAAVPSPQAPSYDQHFRLTRHESCVLALRFAHHADWFITTGKDHQVNAWRTPYGACLLETKEAASVLTCDISPDDKFVVTGSGDKRANLYEIIYGAGSVASSASNVSSH
ncbi:Transducin-like enhancer protein 3 [Echinococcus granulosus]|uniref:Groucho/TLE N-terminal Q-rich domain-containing protein n=1 Tax=Echinococcus granulosus TaxID=6210 RepID=W6ULV3_ECHGR|nr:hypothetical protein EGR_02647 [Echinococcus granulosus]EUB62515.1 hypothetical protein EGR_02647 [Echinococcus granulosus]KAH9283747.1 Transducin-like enhancer protein 3 [Echinococcus granulosus]